MQTIDITERLNTPAEDVFRQLSDHANYSRFPGVAGSDLLRAGHTDRNGTGAARKVRIKHGPTLWEDITDFQPGTSFAYQITKLRPAIFRHHGGRVTVRARDGQTVVHWTSTISVPIPLVGQKIEARLCKIFGGAFSTVLRSIDR